jgi:vitamin B12/bleomycin/antimicrobial peptide transport system ATP-binding/permease protein
MGRDREANGVIDRRRMLARYWREASLFWCGRRVHVAWALTVFLVLIVLMQLLVQYRLNLWNRNFFDALGRRDAAALWTQVFVFMPLAGASIVLSASAVWGRMTTQRKWRESLTRHVISYWIAKDHFRRLNYYNNGSENPEYRISEDVRVATEPPIDLVMAFLSSVLTAIIFLGVLWSVGGVLVVGAFGRVWTIPGHLVIGVVLYSGFFSGMMIMLGRHLTEVVETKNQAEAEFRSAVDVLRQGGERTDADVSRTADLRALWLAVRGALLRWRNLCWQLVRTTLVSQGNVLLAPVVGWLLCVPQYAAGAMSLGELTQAAAAFVTVQGAFNWLVDNYQRLADWRSSVNRVAKLLLAIDALDAAEETVTCPMKLLRPSGHLHRLQQGAEVAQD